MPTEGHPLTPASDPLQVLVDLSRRARTAATEAELGFLLVNDTLRLQPYRQAAWWSGARLRSLSGLVQPDLNAPYAHWLQAVCAHVHSRFGNTTTPFSSQDLPDDLAADWGQWWPAYALWVPAVGEPVQAAGALVLAGDEPWDGAGQDLLREWMQAWAHAWALMRERLGSRWWPARWGAGPRSASGKPAWWRRPAVWVAAAVVVACAFPVRLSVLAPGELVPARPLVVRAPLEGVVEMFHVQPNQEVKKGQLLFTFDEALIKSKLDVARQGLNTASTELRQTSQQALADIRVRTQLAGLSGRIQEKRAEVDYLREQLERTKVVAPGDGVALFDDPSEWIGKPVMVGERILRIAAPGDMEVEVWLPLADAIALESGAPLQLYLNARPLEPVAAQVRYMAHDAVLRPDGQYAYRVRAALSETTTHRVGLKGTARVEGPWVPAIYWVMRRPLAWLRTTLGW